MQPTFRVSDGESTLHASAQAYSSDIPSNNTTMRIRDSRIALADVSSAAPRSLQSSPQVQQRTDVAPQGIADQLITLYMDYIFPISPTVHEPSIRAMVPLLERDGPHGGIPNPVSALQLPSTNLEDMTSLRNRTLLTALCAATALMLPTFIFPMREEIGHKFLAASRGTLKLHQEYGL
jgi:hypothetical protein